MFFALVLSPYFSRAFTLVFSGINAIGQKSQVGLSLPGALLFSYPQ